MFEADLRFKVDSKWPSGQMEERFLNKAFQFFDFHRTGAIDLKQFCAVIERVGVIATKNNAEKIFKEIISMGHGQDGFLNYRDYVKKVYNPASYAILDNQVHKPLATPVYENYLQKPNDPRSEVQYSEYGSSPGKSNQDPPRIKRSGFKEVTQDTLEGIIKEIQQRIKVRGQNGYHTLLESFKNYDPENTGKVNKFEFAKIMREFDLNLLENQFNLIFNAYIDYNDELTIDHFNNRSCCINYHKFSWDLIPEDQQVKTPQEEIKETDRHQREERTSPAKSEPISKQENIQQLTAK